MTTYAELAERMEVEVCTPNEQLFARLRGRYDVTITISPGFVERAGDAETETQLGRLSRLLFMHRADKVNKIKITTLGAPLSHRETERDLEFQRRYAELTVTESSTDGSVSLTVVGLSSWSWTIAHGSAAQHGSERIAAAATDVANKITRRLADEVRRLKVEAYHNHG